MSCLSMYDMYETVKYMLTLPYSSYVKTNYYVIFDSYPVFTFNWGCCVVYIFSWNPSISWFYTFSFWKSCTLRWKHRSPISSQIFSSFFIVLVSFCNYVSWRNFNSWRQIVLCSVFSLSWPVFPSLLKRRRYSVIYWV